MLGAIHTLRASASPRLNARYGDTWKAVVGTSEPLADPAEFGQSISPTQNAGARVLNADIPLNCKILRWNTPLMQATK